MDIVQLFTDVDDFCLFFEPVFKQRLIADKPRQRNRSSMLSTSEVMTIVILFHDSQYRNFKPFYLKEVCQHLSREFPLLPS